MPYQLNREDSMRVKLNAFNHHPKAWFTSRHARHFMLVSLEKEKEKTKQKQEENKTKRSLEKEK